MESNMHLIRSLKSNYLLTLLFSFWGDFFEVFLLFRSLSKRSRSIFASNEQQFRFFCKIQAKKEVLYRFKTLQFTRPFDIQIDSFSFIQLSDDIYKCHEFASNCVGFNKMQFGNTYFQLTGTGDPEIDRQNILTMELFVRKTKKLILNRIDKTIDVLKTVLINPMSYDNLTALSVELSFKNLAAIKEMHKLPNIKDLCISQPLDSVFTISTNNLGSHTNSLFEEECIAVLQSFSQHNLRKLSIFPNQISTVNILVNCQNILQGLEYLKISLDNEKDDIGDNFEAFSVMSNLKTFKLLMGRFNFNIIKHWPQLNILKIVSETSLEPNQDMTTLQQLSSFFFQLQKYSHKDHPDLHKSFHQNLILSTNLKILDIAERSQETLTDLIIRSPCLEKLTAMYLILDSFSLLRVIFQSKSLKEVEIQVKEVQNTQKMTEMNAEGKDNYTLKKFVIMANIYCKEKLMFPPQNFASMLMKCKLLKHLEFFNLCFTEEHVSSFFRPLLHQPDSALMFLHLKTCSFSEESLNFFLQMLAQKEYLLKHLSISNSGLKIENCYDLVKLLSVNKSIQKLDIAQSEIPFSSSFSEFMIAVGNHPSIRYLDMFNSRIGLSTSPENLDAFQKLIIETSQNLKYLYVQEVGKSSNLIDKKEQILNNLKIQLPQMQEFGF